MTRRIPILLALCFIAGTLIPAPAAEKKRTSFSSSATISAGTRSPRSAMRRSKRRHSTRSCSADSFSATPTAWARRCRRSAHREPHDADERTLALAHPGPEGEDLRRCGSLVSSSAMRATPRSSSASAAIVSSRATKPLRHTSITTIRRWSSGGSSQFMADKTIGWLREQKDDRPFCIYLGPARPARRAGRVHGSGPIPPNCRCRRASCRSILSIMASCACATSCSHPFPAIARSDAAPPRRLLRLHHKLRPSRAGCCPS